MEFVSKWWAQIQTQLGELSISARLLIGTLLVMLPLMLWIVVQYAVSPAMVPLLDQSIPAENRLQITAALRDRGMRFETVGDRVHVPRDSQAELLAELQLLQVLPEDTTQAFDAMVQQQTWWQSSEQNQQMMLIAKQQALGRVVRAYPSVRDATVILSMPRDRGFGATHRQPTASVNVVPVAGARLDQDQVEAIAGWVAGAVAEMRPEDVTVIDAVAGRQWTVRDEREVVSGDYLELLHSQEGYVREKLMDTLRYIPEVIVAVNVELDLTQRQIDEMRYDQDSSLELLTNERRDEMQTEGPAGVEPGVRANAGADIGGGGGGGPLTTSETTESEFAPFAGRIHELSSTPGGMPTRVSATVGVPRSFFVQLYRQTQGLDQEAPPPTDADLEPLIEQHTERIQRQVEPLVLAQDAGQVVVDVYPDMPGEQPLDPAQAGPGHWLAEASAVQTLTLGGLAAMALVMMFLMVRKASQKPETPSARELAGLPPQVGGEVDLVGEVDEADSALDGMELDDETLRHKKVADQVSEMVKANPSEVARVVNRWMEAS